MQNRTVFRVQKDKENPYVMLNKEFLDNDKLSWKAKGLLTYLLSKPDDWRIIISDLIKKSTDGRDCVYSIIKELIKEGYIIRKSNRENGKYSGLEYIILETPTIAMDCPLPENPNMVKEDMVNPPLLINDNTNKLYKLKNQSVSQDGRTDGQVFSDPVLEVEQIFEQAKLDKFSKDDQDIIKCAVEDMYFSSEFAKKLDIPHSIVKARLHRLDNEAVGRILDDKNRAMKDEISGEYKDIKNWNGYFKKLLWNAIMDAKRWSK